MLHRIIHQNRYRLKAELNIGKFEVHQGPHKRGYVAITTTGYRWKSHIAKGQKKWRTADSINMDGLPCGLARMQN
jgi:hypothetical protein